MALASAIAGAGALGASGCSTEPKVTRGGSKTVVGSANGSGGGAQGSGANGAGAIVEEIASGLAIVASEPASGTVHITDLWPKPGETQAWAVISSGSRGGASVAPINFSTRTATRFGADLEVAEGGDQTLFLDGVDSGNPTMVASISHRDSALSRFQPALGMGREELSPGVPFEASAPMIVETLDQPPKERDRGVSRRTITYVRDETIRTTMGDRRCQRVETEFTADLKLADATVRTVRWIVPGVGAIAEERSERIVVMGLVPTDRHRVIVREQQEYNGGGAK